MLFPLVVGPPAFYYLWQITHPSLSPSENPLSLFQNPTQKQIRRAPTSSSQQLSSFLLALQSLMIKYYHTIIFFLKQFGQNKI